MLDALTAGTVGLREVFDRAETDEVIGKTQVIAIVKALPGIGLVRAAEHLRRCEIPTSSRVRGISATQRRALLAALNQQPAPR